jgi:DNA-binding NtrC family response regulator
MTRTGDENVFSNVLILELDSRKAAGLLEELARRNIRGTVAVNDQQAMNLAERAIWNLAFVSDDFMACYHGSSETILRTLRHAHPELPIAMIGSTDSSHKALQAVRNGFVEYLVRPVDGVRAADTLDRFVPNHPIAALQQVGSSGWRSKSIVGDSPAFRRTVELARKAAPTSAPILIEGESGTGKELLAQLIHESSRRSKGPFIKINCAAMNESLLESELFGHEKGAFTGAIACRKGRFEMADGGTLMLDEITETPPAFQAKLLRAIEEMNFERVGGNESVRVNVRILSTTNRPIVEDVRQGRFRGDLYYRLSGIRLCVPPLRSRREDIADLIWLFVNEFACEAGRRITGVERKTLALFEQYRWPGNIRQLRNMVRSAMILGSGQSLSVNEVPWLFDELTEDLQPQECGRQNPLLSAGSSLEEIERKAILNTLDCNNGNQAQAARILGISDRTLRDKIKRYHKERELETVETGNINNRYE